VDGEIVEVFQYFRGVNACQCRRGGRTLRDSDVKGREGGSKIVYGDADRTVHKERSDPTADFGSETLSPENSYKIIVIDVVEEALDVNGQEG
jgi:hypothetical protein